MGGILCYLLIGGRDMILPRLRRMLQEDSPMFPIVVRVLQVLLDADGTAVPTTGRYSPIRNA